VSLVLAGRIVPLTNDTGIAPKESSSFKGKVWIGDDGRIAAVTKGAKKGPPGFESAAVVDVGSQLVVPGFIDLHSHLAYATLPLWVEPNRVVPFEHHNVWPSRPTYAENVTWPAYAFVEAAPAELLAYAEVRALIGGTTSIQGSPPSNKPLDGWLVRNVEDETFGGQVGANQVLASTLTLKAEQLGDRANRMRQGVSFIYHCAEGRPGSIATREYDAVQTAGCLQRGLVAIHTCAVDAARYAAWSGEPGSIVWSPFSNLWLYGTTTDVAAARARGLNVCVGSDWGPSGTRNVLGELKVASLVNDAKGWGLSPFDLVKMITANPGDALVPAWGIQAGRLQPGASGDVTVIAAAPGVDPFKTILRATEDDVQLVVIGGRALYGVGTFMARAGATPATTSALQVNGQARRLALTRFDGSPGQPWSFAEVLARLEAVRSDPKAAIEEARALAFAALRSGDPPRLRLALDMPTGRVPVGGLPKDLAKITVPPIQPLPHDAAFFAAITGRGFHGGLLDGLAGFYQ
jgi:cytosine/adenosine deaminase-related metal-dependent hydrolase